MLRAVAFAVMVDWETKFNPLMVNTVSPLPAVSAAGEIEEITGGGLRIVAMAEAERVGSAVLVAVTVSVLGEGGMGGAV
jgi:hypothetical protein